MTAWLFGATDAAGGITIGKTPASVWVMTLSVRLSGPEMGGEIGWLLPAALILLGWGLWATRGAHSPHRTRQRTAIGDSTVYDLTRG